MIYVSLTRVREKMLIVKTIVCSGRLKVEERANI